MKLFELGLSQPSPVLQVAMKVVVSKQQACPEAPQAWQAVPPSAGKQPSEPWHWPLQQACPAAPQAVQVPLAQPAPAAVQYGKANPPSAAVPQQA